jgi:hypothetical protein
VVAYRSFFSLYPIPALYIETGFAQAKIWNNNTLRQKTFRLNVDFVCAFPASEEFGSGWKKIPFPDHKNSPRSATLAHPYQLCLAARRVTLRFEWKLLLIVKFLWTNFLSLFLYSTISTALSRHRWEQLPDTNQFCGFGSRIRCLFDPWIRDPDPGQLFGLKYLNYLMWIWDPGWEKVGSGINIPDPQH